MKHLKIEELTLEELTNINGGHDGTAYEVGQAVGTVIKVIGMVTGAYGAWRLLRRIF